MATANRIEFLKQYLDLCEKHGFFIYGDDTGDYISTFNRTDCYTYPEHKRALLQVEEDNDGSVQ